MIGKNQFDATGDTQPIVGKAYETAASTLVESILGEVDYGQRGYDTRTVPIVGVTANVLVAVPALIVL